MKKNLPYIIAAIAFCISFISPLFFILGILLFLGCAIAVWIQDIHIIGKILFLIVPIFLWTPVKTIINNIEGNITYFNEQRIDFIFPENFEGDAVIVTEKDCGQAIKKDALGFEKLYIPEDGILYYKGNIENLGKWYNFRYFKINKTDTIEIPDTYIREYVNTEWSEFKVCYVNGETNESNNLSKIHLFLFNSEKGENLCHKESSDEILEMEYECR